jgi:hypothetical protein
VQPIGEHGTVDGSQVGAHLVDELDAEPFGVRDQVGQLDRRAHRSTSTAGTSGVNGGVLGGRVRQPGARSGRGGSTGSGIGGKTLSPIDNERNPGGYCGLGGTGVSCPIGVAATG